MKKKSFNITEIKSKLALDFFEGQDTYRYLRNLNKKGVNALFQFGESVLPGYYLNIKRKYHASEYNNFQNYKEELDELLKSRVFLEDNIINWPELIIFAVLSKDLLEYMEIEYFAA